MVPLGQCTCVSKDATLHDAAVALEEARNKHEDGACQYLAVLVCDDAGRAIGKLSLLDLFRLSLRDFLRSLEPKKREMTDPRKIAGNSLLAEVVGSTVNAYDLCSLEELCRTAADMNVDVITRSPLDGEFIDAEATLNEAIHQLIMGCHQSLLATSEGQIVGILRLADVCVQVGKRIRAR
jgi:CBS domain-containing protein